MHRKFIIINISSSFSNLARECAPIQILLKLNIELIEVNLKNGFRGAVEWQGPKAESGAARRGRSDSGHSTATERRLRKRSSNVSIHSFDTRVVRKNQYVTIHEVRSTRPSFRLYNRGPMDFCLSVGSFLSFFKIRS